MRRRRLRVGVGQVAGLRETQVIEQCMEERLHEEGLRTQPEGSRKIQRTCADPA